MRYLKTSGIALLAALLLIAAGCGKKEEKKAEGKGEAAREAPRAEPTRPADRPREAPRPQPREAEKRTAEGVLQEATGTVEVRRTGDDDFVAAKKGVELFAGDAVRLGADGEAVLALWDHTAVELTPESAVSVGSSAAVANPSPNVTVLSGAVRLDVPARAEGQGPLMVYSPSSAVAVQGTTLAVGVGLTGDSRVAVEEGKVDLTAAAATGKAIQVPAGKVVEVPAGKKAGGAKPYNAEKAGWDEWLEAQGKKAAAKADQVAKDHAAAVAQLDKQADTLETAEDNEDKAAEELEKKAEDAEKAKKAADYKAVQPKIAEKVETIEAVEDQSRMINGRMRAHAYLLGLLHGRASAGVYKVPPAKLKVVAAQLGVAGKVVPRYWVRRYKRRLRRARRRRQWKRWYHLHHPRGRVVAVKAGFKVPGFYAKLKLRRKMRRRRIKIAGWRGGVFVRPRYRGRRLKVGWAPRPRRGWYRKAGWRARHARHSGRRVVRRKVWRKAVVARRMKRWKKRPKVRRHRWGIRTRFKARFGARFRPGRGLRVRGRLGVKVGPGMRPLLRGMGPHLRGMGPHLRGMVPPGLRGMRPPGLRGMRPPGLRGMRPTLRGMRPPLRGMRPPLRGKRLRKKLRKRRGMAK